MTWLEHHQVSERRASEAEAAARRGDHSHAKQLYAEAAKAEEQALRQVMDDKPRTYSVTAVSAVALYYKAAAWLDAQILAYRCLGSERLQEFASQQIEEMLDSIRVYRAGIDADNASVLVSAKGGQLVTGGAPLDLVMAKAREMKSLLYRATEYMKNVPHRKRGGPSKELQESYRLWMFQAPAGSYQFAVSLQQPAQLRLFDEDIAPHQIVDGLFRILQACATSPRNRLPEIVRDGDYADTFLKLTRDLAPKQRAAFTQLDIRVASAADPVTLRSDARDSIDDALRGRHPAPPDTQEEEIHGVLRALHLDRDWIEVVPRGETKGLKIENTGEEVDDRIGPMVNNLVVVRVARKGEKRTFIDIDAAD